MDYAKSPNVVSRFGRGAIESGCRTHSGAGAGDWRLELLEDGGAAAGSSRMASGKLRLDISSWRAGGRLCACGSRVLSGRARAAATTRMRAGWEPEPRAARGAPIISSFTRAEGWLGSRGPRECGPGGAGSGGASEGGRSRTHYPELDTRSGWEPALREEVRDRSRTHFLCPD